MNTQELSGNEQLLETGAVNGGGWSTAVVVTDPWIWEHCSWLGVCFQGEEMDSGIHRVAQSFMETSSVGTLEGK